MWIGRNNQNGRGVGGRNSTRRDRCGWMVRNSLAVRMLFSKDRDWSSFQARELVESLVLQ